jgi:hypothetical protein
VEVAHGGNWYAGALHRGPRQFDSPAAWAGFAGHYRSPIPWYNNFRVVIRRGVLLLVSPEGLEELLMPVKEPGRFRIGGAADSAEEIVFDTVVSGRALRATLSGVGATDAEVVESKQYLIGSMPRTLETNLGIATFLQTEEFFGLGLDYDLRVPGLLQAVTRDGIHEAARRTLVPSHATVVIAGPYAGDVQ